VDKRLITVDNQPRLGITQRGDPALFSS